MKTSKIIFHIDMNCFYAACEAADNKDLLGKPIVVAHNDPLRRSIILTASYEARKYGIRTTMSVGDAIKLCNHVQVIEPHMERYQYYSKQFFDYLISITPILEKASIDEGYLDVTEPCTKIHPLELAQKIQKDLWEQFHLPCSIGIAPNKFLSKMASDFKKPMGITIFRKREIDQHLWKMPIQKMHGIGKKTAPKLLELGIATIGDLANYKDKQKLINVLGEAYTVSLVERANGIDQSTVEWEGDSEVSSVSNSHTFDKDYSDELYIKSALKALNNSVSHRLQNKKLKAQTIGIQIRFNNYKQINRSKAAIKSTNDEREMLALVYELYDEWVELHSMVRLVGVFATRLIEEKQETVQYSIFDDLSSVEKEHEVHKLIEDMKNKYGKTSIDRGYYPYGDNEEK